MNTNSSDSVESGNGKFANLEKAKTFVKGLDEILEGGFPRGRITLLKGGTGSGKTILGQEFIYRGALDGEPGIIVGFEETSVQVHENVSTLGWDFNSLEEKKLIYLIEAQPNPDTILSGDFSLKGLLASISGISKEIGAKRIVLDALDVVLRMFKSNMEVRNQLHILNDWLRKTGLTTLMTLRPSKHSDSPFEEFFDSICDCSLQMDVRILDQISTRRLRIIKYRGSAFGRNEYPYVIKKGGIHAAPISTFGLRHKPLGEMISTGIKRLDSILNGGYRRAACILIAGLPGAGKTILASTFTQAACSRGEKVIYVGFEESMDAVLGNVKSAGIDLQEYVENGALTYLTNFPEAKGAEEHYIDVLDRMDDFNPQHVIIDAISACERMGGKLAAFEYLMRILNVCKERGVTIIMLNQLSGTNNYLEISGNGISSMVDTAIFLSYDHIAGETNRLLEILKSRGSGHSNQKREYIITDEGIKIFDPYVGKGSVLTGTARQLQEAKDRTEKEKLDFEIKRKEIELERLRYLMKKSLNGIRASAEMKGEDLNSESLTDDNQ